MWCQKHKSNKFLQNKEVCSWLLTACYTLLHHCRRVWVLAQLPPDLNCCYMYCTKPEYICTYLQIMTRTIKFFFTTTYIATK
jgi:hypothetical protein